MSFVFFAYVDSLGAEETAAPRDRDPSNRIAVKYRYFTASRSSGARATRVRNKKRRISPGFSIVEKNINILLKFVFFFLHYDKTETKK